MTEEVLLNYIRLLTWPLIAAGMLFVGFILGIIFGRSRAREELEGQIQDTQDALEWEQAHYKELEEKSAIELEKLQEEMNKETDKPEDEKIILLRKEVHRLYSVLQKSWLTETQHERRIRHLEATLSNLTKKSDSKVKQTELEL